MQEKVVIVVGAGPGGLATAAALTLASVPYIILERDDCYAPMWKKKAYDRLHFHLPKHFCELPYMPFPSHYPKYVPKDQFAGYLDDYVERFKISPMYNRIVELAFFDEKINKWYVKVKNGATGDIEEYACAFLVVATGGSTDPFVPAMQGLESFTGEYLHTTQFKNGKPYKDKNVLVIGSGNSGLEIALDLSNFGAKTSIVIRSPLQFVTRGMVHVALILFKFLPFKLVDAMLVMMSNLKYGDMTKYGIRRPKEGPYTMKVNYGKFPSFDFGICDKIKSGEVQVLPAATSIRGTEVLFENGESHPFDVIIFATGFRRSTSEWLKGDDYLLDEKGVPKQGFPNNWKGRNGLYCVGLARRGLYGISEDVHSISKDIKEALSH